MAQEEPVSPEFNLTADTNGFKLISNVLAAIQENTRVRNRNSKIDATISLLFLTTIIVLVIVF